MVRHLLGWMQALRLGLQARVLRVRPKVRLAVSL
jgi:hypothetical protein